MARRRRLGEILVDAGLIDDFQLRSALSDQKRWGRPLGVTLLKLGFMNEEELVRVLSRQLDVPIVDLHDKRISAEALSALSIQVAEKARCIPLFKREEHGRAVLYLGMEDPTDLSVLDDLAFRTGMEIRPVLVGPNQLTDAIDRHYNTVEWGGDDDPEPEIGMVEPGDTAPMVFKPEQAVDPVTPLGPEGLEPAGFAGDTPAGEPEFTFVESEPATPGADLQDFSHDDMEVLDAAADAPRSLGPEFITDEPAVRPPLAGEADPTPEHPALTLEQPDPALQQPVPAPPQPVPAPQRPVPTPEHSPAFEPRPEPAPTAAADPPRGTVPSEVPSRTILRAVTKLLVEKGVFERHELVAVIRELQELDPEA